MEQNHKTMKCPRCSSEKIQQTMYLNTKCVVCKSCGFDERDELDGVPTQKQGKSKGSYTPYKTGGARRTQR